MRAYKNRNSYRQVVMISYETEELIVKLSEILKTRPHYTRNAVVRRAYASGSVTISELTSRFSRTYIGCPRTKVEQITAPTKDLLNSIAYETGIGMGVLLSVAVIKSTQDYLRYEPTLLPLYNKVYSQCTRGGF